MLHYPIIHKFTHCAFISMCKLRPLMLYHSGVKFEFGQQLPASCQKSVCNCTVSQAVNFSLFISEFTEIVYSPLK